MNVWWITFAGRPVTERAGGRTPEEAAERVARRYFGRRAQVRRIAGIPGWDGAFEAFVVRDGEEKAITVFDVDATEPATHLGVAQGTR